MKITDLEEEKKERIDSIMMYQFNLGVMISDMVKKDNNLIKIREKYVNRFEENLKEKRKSLDNEITLDNYLDEILNEMTSYMENWFFECLNALKEKSINTTEYEKKYNELSEQYC